MDYLLASIQRNSWLRLYLFQLSAWTVRQRSIMFLIAIFVSLLAENSHELVFIYFLRHFANAIMFYDHNLP